MATVLLSAAGAAAGTAVGGSLGPAALGLTSTAIGRAAGAIAGSLVDQRILGPGAQTVEGPRLDRIRIQTSTQGAPLPRVWGRMRVAGQVIWATRFKERLKTTTQGGGGKGGGGGSTQTKTTSYSYSLSFAVALCVGPIDRIGRVWADGKPFTLSEVSHRLYLGGSDQVADPLIQSVEGVDATPAYRGTAYLVFEDLPLGPFGDRVPQISVEVFRKPVSASSEPDLADLVRGVALSPGTGEFAYATTPVRRVLRPGVYESENVHSFDGRADVDAALDQLELELPKVSATSLVVSWFGTDLRAALCSVRPGVELAERQTEPLSWSAGGIARGSAHVVSKDAEGRPSYGGTPSDASVIEALKDLRARGHEVLFYPFLLMDIPPGNTLPDPWTGAASQPVFPWRGRITLAAAPGQPGSSDQTPAAAAEVASFFGQAKPGDFHLADGVVQYHGPAEWGFRRFILHYAHLAKAAGGVDAFAIGSELRSLTQIRSDKATYPAVNALRDLAADVRAILGPDVRITYAADWSEYFGHQPNDGSGDAMFHLDPLWADDNIDAIGIDAYFPLSDWRDETDGDADRDGSIYDLDYLTENIEGGEGYDWFYGSDVDRTNQNRSAIEDAAHGEDWVFRPKDLRAWWTSPHHNRPNGVREGTPTNWLPQSKPIWLTELGCPAVDRASNQPNVFYDPVSSEGGLPHFSRGGRDDLIQRRYIEAVLSYWSGDANPISSVYGAPMLDLSRAFIWTWDVRPWPDFPQRETVWSDGPKHDLGHWLTGRLGGAPLADLVRAICAEHGVADVDASELKSVVHGLVADRVLSARELLQPLMLAYGFDAVEVDGVLRFKHRGDAPATPIFIDGMVVDDLPDEVQAPLELQTDEDLATPTSARLTYVQGAADYEPGSAESKVEGEGREVVSVSELPLALTPQEAQAITDRWLSEAMVARDTATFTAPPSNLGLTPGDTVALNTGAQAVGTFRIARIQEAGQGREIEAVRIESRHHSPNVIDPPLPSAYPTPALLAPPEVAFLDLPLVTGAETPHAPHIAAFVAPWPTELSVYRSDRDEGYLPDTTITTPAMMGLSLDPLPVGRPNLWTGLNGFRVAFSDAELLSRDELAVLNGANAAAIETPAGAWEVFQFRNAELIAANEYRLSWLLRGQAGTEADMDVAPSGSRVVILSDALQQSTIPETARGLTRHFRVGPSQRGYVDASYRHVVASFKGVGLRPYAPTHLKATRSSDGGIALSWIRRTRYGGDNWENVDSPLGEETERYRIRLLAEEAEIASVVSEGSVYSFDPAPSLAQPLIAKVAQLSAVYGPGPETSVDVPL
ncbi:MAG: glycoside hydrolase TIM-barrel-like domain-containing protein [Pseudomonadota bacterium]